MGRAALFNLEGASRLRAEVCGGIAQLVEHLLCKQGVIGSSPIISTNVRARAPEGAGARIQGPIAQLARAHD